MTAKAIIFDLDGTLLNTLDDLADAANHVLTANQMPPHPVESYKTFLGNGAATLISRALPEQVRGTEIQERCLELFLTRYKETWNVKTAPYDGILELLTELAENRIPTAVATNKPQQFADACVAAYFPGHSFSQVMGGRDQMPLKPHPASALAIADHWGLAPGDILFLGDSDVDIHTGRNAGMVPVGALWGFRSQTELESAGADHLVAHPGELRAMVGI